MMTRNNRRPDSGDFLTIALVAFALCCIIVVVGVADAAIPQEDGPAWVPWPAADVTVEQEHRWALAKEETEWLIVDDRGNIGINLPVEGIVFTPDHPPEGLSKRCLESARVMRAKTIVCLETSELGDALFDHGAKP